MKVVIDSNVFVGCLNSFSPNHIIFSYLVKGKYKLCVSTEVSMEYLEIFWQKFKPTKASLFFEFIETSPHVLHTEIYYNWGLIANDPDDNKFVDCAVAAGASFIVTDDAHFDILKTIRFPNVTCIKTTDFVEMLKAKQD